MELYGEGSIQFYCQPGENGTSNKLKTNHGEAYADLRSPDGVWVGTFEYPIDGVFIGQPTWTVTNQITGETRIIHGNNDNDVKVPSPEGYDVAWTRRRMWGDESTLDRVATPEELADDSVPKLIRGYDNATIVPAGPKTQYVVRTETYAGLKPQTTECVGVAGDYWVPFTAKYSMLSCDNWLLNYANYLPAQAPGQEPFIRGVPSPPPPTTTPPATTLPPPTTPSPTQPPTETPEPTPTPVVTQPPPAATTSAPTATQSTFEPTSPPVTVSGENTSTPSVGQASGADSVGIGLWALAGLNTFLILMA